MRVRFPAKCEHINAQVKLATIEGQKERARNVSLDGVGSRWRKVGERRGAKDLDAAPVTLS